MRICIDSIGFTRLHGTGLYTYTYELLNNLFEIYPQPVYDLIWDESSLMGIWRNSRKINIFPLHKRDCMESLKLMNNYIMSNRISLFHSPNNGFSIPLEERKGRCKYLITVHDLIALTNSELVDEEYLNRFQYTFPRIVNEVDRIIAVSNFIKKQLMNELNIPENKIEVIYPGCSNQFRPMDREKCMEFLKTAYDIEGDFIFYGGSIHIRKNFEVLFQAFKDLGNNYKNLKLIIAGSIDGKRQGYYLKLKSLLRDLNIERNIIFVGNVKYEHMPYFYNGSKGVVNLSDYEGFSQTSIETISCGIPLICSNIEPFIETVRNHAILVDVKKVQEVKDAILELLEQDINFEELVRKNNIIQKEFNWNDSIRNHVKIYEKVILDC